MSAETVPVPPAPLPLSPEATKALNLLRVLPEADLAAVRDKLVPPKPSARFPVPRTPAGGIEQVLSIDDVLERVAEMDKEARVGVSRRSDRYNFSSIGMCFLKEWFKEKGVMPDDGIADLNSPESAYRFDPGNSEPGHATENHIQLLMEQVYTRGGPGAVLKDVRLSQAIQVEYEGKDGKLVKSTIYQAGKSDIVVVGDNLEVLDFMELKSPIFWTRDRTRFIGQFGKTVPLALASVEEPQAPDGQANINNLLQLAVGVQILTKRGLQPKKVTLLYISRERYREHLAILLSPADVAYLAEMAVWWTTEHHINLQSDEPPEPRFFMSWEEKPGYCPFQQRCAALAKTRGIQRAIHPAMVGLNDRLDAANVAMAPVSEAEDFRDDEQHGDDQGDNSPWRLS